MKKIEKLYWIYYVADSVNYDRNKVGKWMYHFSGREGAAFADKICREAVETGIVREAKYTNPESFGMNPNAKSPDSGVACFYLNIDDMEGHKKVIRFFLDNELIRKTKAGKYYNIGFKLDDQTRAGEYGSGFVSELKLEQLMDLNTGEWIAEEL